MSVLVLALLDNQIFAIFSNRNRPNRNNAPPTQIDVTNCKKLNTLDLLARHPIDTRLRQKYHLNTNDNLFLDEQQHPCTDHKSKKPNLNISSQLHQCRNMFTSQSDNGSGVGLGVGIGVGTGVG